MALSFPLTFSMAPLPTGIDLDANGFAQAMVGNLQASISGNFLTGQIGGLAPTQNVGPWLNNQAWWFWDTPSQSYVQQSLTSSFPSGSIIMYGGVSPPTGFLLCDGSLYLRATYPNLFAVIGGTYNNGDGSSTFGVPDMRGRAPMCNGLGSGLTGRTLGQTFGEETHALTTTELATHAHGITDPTHAHGISDPTHNHGISDPSHNHVINNPAHTHGVSDPGHLHSGIPNEGVTAYNPGASFLTSIVAGVGNTGASATGISIQNAATSITANGAFTGVSVNSAFTGVSVNGASTGISVNNSGSGSGHNTIPPSLVVGFIIKT